MSCSVEHCGRRAKCRGYCTGHYARHRDGRPVAGPIGPRNPTTGACLVEGCEKPIRARRLCRGHYQRQYNGNELGGPIIRRRDGSGSIDKRTGYKVVTVGGVRYLEHRLVMERTLGRPLLATERVHHRNGDRLDNSPGNLELWTRGHPSGQRVADLVAFVVATYPELVAAASVKSPTSHPSKVATQ